MSYFQYNYIEDGFNCQIIGHRNRKFVFIQVKMIFQKKDRHQTSYSSECSRPSECSLKKYFAPAAEAETGK